MRRGIVPLISGIHRRTQTISVSIGVLHSEQCLGRGTFPLAFGIHQWTLTISVSIGVVVTHFWIPTKKKKKWKWENTKKYIKKIFERNPKIIGVRKGCWNAEKRIEIDWGDSKIQELKFWQYIFDWWEPLG
jgi:hypothetical protein